MNDTVDDHIKSATEDTVAADPIDLTGHHDMGDELATGPATRVVRATDRRLGRPVAIKVLRTAGDGSEALFEREVRITARLQHPSIVAVHEAGTLPSGEPYLAMKLVAGRPIDRLIAEAKTPDERMALLPRALAVADALAYAHVEGVVHRAIEPANVLCAEHGETVVIDWGHAKELSSSDLDLDSTIRGRGGSAGSSRAYHAPAYMPPELAKNLPVNARGDVYSLGAVLYHVLSGVAPYQGRDADTVVANVLAGPPPSLRIRAPNVSPRLVAIVEKAMARDPQQRYASGKQMADELRRFEAAQLVAIPSGSLGELVTSAVRRNRRAVLIGAGVLLVLILIVVLAGSCGPSHPAGPGSGVQKPRAWASSATNMER
jgi:serine/threonine protein kinase